MQTTVQETANKIPPECVAMVITPPKDRRFFKENVPGKMLVCLVKVHFM